MQNELDVWLTSPDLYESVFTSLNKGLGSGVLLTSFNLNDHARLSLVPTSFIENVINNIKGSNPHSDAVYFDDRYSNLRQFSENGLKTIWFNPGGEVVGDDLPRHDGEIRNLDEIVNITSLVDKPSLEQCLAWLDEWDVPENIRAHADVVSWSAYVLAVKMRNQGIWVDPVLTHRGGLLHDIDKIATLNREGAHGKMGADFLLEQGYPELAQIVRGHIMSRIKDPDAEDWGWGVKLVFFCDKLVEGDRLVSFDARLKALKKRYPHYVGPMESAESAIWGLSDTICEILGIPSHEDLIAMLRESLYR